MKCLLCNGGSDNWANHVEGSDYYHSSFAGVPCPVCSGTGKVSFKVWFFMQKPIIALLTGYKKTVQGIRYLLIDIGLLK